MQRHRSMTEEPVLAFGGHGGPEGNPQDLHKSASDPSHIVHGLQGMGSLTWVSLNVLLLAPDREQLVALSRCMLHFLRCILVRHRSTPFPMC